MQRAYSVLLSTREKSGQRYITATRTADVYKRQGKNRNEREVAEMTNKKGSRQLAWTDRISIEALKKAGHSVIEIAEDVYKRQ